MTNNSAIVFYIVSVILALLLSSFIIGVIIRFLNIKNKLKREYLHKLSLENEKAMQHIAMEVHDNLGQVLFVINNDLRKLQENIHHHTEDQNTLNRLLHYSQMLMEEVKDISHSYHTELIGFLGFVTVIAEKIEKLNTENKTTFSLSETGKFPKTLFKEKEIMLVRFMQEALHNIAKHSQATEAQVNIITTGNNCTISISDNGIGFDVKNATQCKGLGIKNMQQRAFLLEGTMNIASEPQKGTEITLMLTVSKLEKSFYYPL